MAHRKAWKACIHCCPTQETGISRPCLFHTPPSRLLPAPLLQEAGSSSRPPAQASSAACLHGHGQLSDPTRAPTVLNTQLPIPEAQPHTLTSLAQVLSRLLEAGRQNKRVSEAAINIGWVTQLSYIDVLGPLFSLLHKNWSRIVSLWSHQWHFEQHSLQVRLSRIPQHI